MITRSLGIQDNKLYLKIFFFFFYEKDFTVLLLYMMPMC